MLHIINGTTKVLDKILNPDSRPTETDQKSSEFGVLEFGPINFEAFMYLTFAIVDGGVVGPVDRLVVLLGELAEAERHVGGD